MPLSAVQIYDFQSIVLVAIVKVKKWSIYNVLSFKESRATWWEEDTYQAIFSFIQLYFNTKFLQGQKDS